MKQLKNTHLSLFVLLLLTIAVTVSNKQLIQVKNNIPNLLGFKCFGATKMSTPVRLAITGEVECFSLDGKNCSSGFESDVECKEYVARHLKKVMPVGCHGNDYKKLAWCSQGKEFFYNTWQCPSDTGLPQTFRINQKTFEVECLSLDGKKCLADEKMCNKIKKGGEDVKQYKIITCNRAVEAKEKGRWCKKAFSHFLYNEQFICKDKSGLDIAIRLTEEGDIECLSSDGKFCIGELHTPEKCKAKLQEELEYEPKVRTVVCGDHHKSIFQTTGYDNPKHWCSLGYALIHSKLGVSANQMMTEFEQNSIGNQSGIAEIPKWFQKLQKIFNNPAEITDEKLNKIKKKLENKGSNLTDEKWKEIQLNLKKGDVKSIEQAVQAVVAITPQLKKIEDTKSLAESIVDPEWFNKIKELLKKPEAKTQEKLIEIDETLRRHQFEYTSARWKDIESNIMSGEVRYTPATYNRIIQMIREHTPSLKETAKYYASKDPNYQPEWFNNLEKFLSTEDSTKEEGIQKVKKTLDEHKSFLTDNKWNEIKEKIKSGKLVKDKAIRDDVVRTFKDFLPNFSEPIQEEIVVPGKPKQCGSSFLADLRDLLRRRNAKTDAGLKRIRDLLELHFEVTPQSWKEIEDAIRDGSLTSIDEILDEPKVEKPKKKERKPEEPIKDGKKLMLLKSEIRRSALFSGKPIEVKKEITKKILRSVEVQAPQPEKESGWKRWIKKKVTQAGNWVKSKWNKHHLTSAQPPAAQPPTAKPPATQPPVAQPPAPTPPAAQPPAPQPPAAQPPVPQPPAAQPPAPQHHSLRKHFRGLHDRARAS